MNAYGYSLKAFKAQGINMEQSAVIDERDKILLAANWKSLKDHQINIDPSYHAFIRVFEYRREIAIRLLEEKSDVNREYLRECFNHCNKQIADILGL